MIAGFGAAVRLMYAEREARFERVRLLHDTLLEKLSGMEGITLNSHPDGSPYIVNFSVEGIRSETMLHYLERREIYVSSGSACSKGAKSGVLSAYGIPDAQADSAIRVSFDADTELAALDTLLEAIREGQTVLIHKKI